MERVAALQELYEAKGYSEDTVMNLLFSILA